LCKAGFDQERASVIYCGIDDAFRKNTSAGSGKLRSLCGIGPADFLCVYYGRPGITKGVGYLVDAMPLVQPYLPNSHLVMILSREPAAQYRRILDQVGALCSVSNIHIIDSFPARSELIEHLMDADCVVIPSLTEGFGLTAVEACALGIPVVATRAGSLPEVVSGRYVLVEPASSHALAAGIVRIWQRDYDQWRDPKEFSWEKMVAQYENLYLSLLG
jgi:glycosyltransferase involved in cell wall biosynthesis